MKMLIGIDQSAAIAAGHNCHSTAEIDVDVTTLTPEDRALVARFFHDGQLRVGQTGPRLVAMTPTVDGVIAAVRLAEAKAARAEDESKQREAAEIEQDRLTAARLSTEIVAGRHLDNLYYDDAVAGGWYSGVIYRLLRGNHIESHAMLTPEAREIIRAAGEQQVAAREAEKVRKAAEEAAWEAIRNEEAALLGGTFNGRWQAGLATRDELTQRIGDRERTRLGLTNEDTWDHSESAESVTDEQFESLQAWKQTLPQGSEVKVLLVWDDPDEDADQDVEQNQQPERRTVGIASWTYRIWTLQATVRL